VYRHALNAIPAFWLMAMLAFNLFHAFLNRNPKPVLRLAHTARYWAEQIAGEFCQVVGCVRCLAPP